MRRTLVTWLGLLAAGPAVVAGCGSDDATGEQAARGDTVKVGVVLSITGPGGSLGTPERDTVRAFQDQMSDAGDAQIEWIVEDDGSDTNRAVAAVNRLIAEEQVDAIICCTTSPNSLAVQAAIAPTGVPTIALAAATAITEPTEEKQLFFKTPFNDRLTLEVTAADMNRRGNKRVAFLASDDAYGESGLKAFEAAARSNGLTLTGTETFAPTDTDVTAQISRLRGGDPDAYMIWGIPPAAAVVQRNLRQLGITEPAYQGLGVTNATFLKLSGKSAEGVRMAAGKLLVGSSLPADDPLAESIQSFTDRYREAVGGEPNPFAGYAHDAMLITKSAVARAGAGSDGDLRTRIRDEIERTRDLVGVTGVYNFAPDDHVGLDDSSVAMIEVENGKFVPARD